MITYKKARDKRKLGLEAALVQLLLIVIAIAAVALVALYFLGLIGHAAPKGGVVIKSVACKPCGGKVNVIVTVQNVGNIKEKITLCAVPTSTSSASGPLKGSNSPCVCPGKCCTICIKGLCPGCGYDIIAQYCANGGSVKGSVSYPLTPV
jgi:hypothetical protein